MTGFGRAERAAEDCALTVEARSVNSRHLDVALRLPSSLVALELDARRLIQSRLERGRIDVTVQLSPRAGRAAQHVRVDADLARTYMQEAQALGRALGVGDRPALTWLLERPGVVQLEESAPPSPEAMWPLLEAVLRQALDELIERRTTEGAALAAELRTRHADLQHEVAVIAERAPLAAARRSERLRERMRALLGEAAVDEARVLTEAAVWASKTDVAEELARLGAHLAEFAVMLDRGGPVGRPFDFLIQELNREVNTVAAKSDDLEISQATLAAKGIIEKMREQVQNIE
ncbi:MAG: YicC family protein [Candidatus Rokubacteria bacterium]|nr:YicC family protein [Candidatus Rokubacteria bacterium]